MSNVAHFMLKHSHAVALPAIDAVLAACCSDTKLSCPGQLGTSPADFCVGCVCRSIANTDTLRLLTDGNQT